MSKADGCAGCNRVDFVRSTVTAFCRLRFPPDWQRGIDPLPTQPVIRRFPRLEGDHHNGLALQFEIDGMPGVATSIGLTCRCKCRRWAMTTRLFLSVSGCARLP